MHKPLVDPFIPVRRHRRLSNVKIQSPSIQMERPQPIKSKDSVPAQTPLTAKLKRKLFGPRAQLAGIIIVAALAGLLMTIQLAGEILIGIYAVLALLFKIKSKVSFVLACTMLIFVVVLLFAEPSRTMAMAFATYAFLFLIVGTITSVFESRRNDPGTSRPGLRISQDE